MQSKGKVMVGMSGGVDSSVAALLLLEQGYQVVGATFRLWNPADAGLGGESSCCSADDADDARFVCHALGIPHYVLNYKDLFRESVVDYFVAEYRRGATPNPCIACNRHIKFGAFIQKARSMDFDFIATGHYATVERDAGGRRYRLRKGQFAAKDQSYVLYCLTQPQLAATLMPLGGYRKEEIRAMAAEHGLLVSGKPDSQDICFVPGGDYSAFLSQYTGKSCPRGDFVDADGRSLGRHRGIWSYTIGQRRGLSLSFENRKYVTAIDAQSNTVTLGENEDLLRRKLTARDVNWIDFDAPARPMRLGARIRYNHAEQPATVTPLPGGGARVVFDHAQRAVTPGQAVVFYSGDYVAGGGTIEK